MFFSRLGILSEVWLFPDIVVVHELHRLLDGTLLHEMYIDITHKKEICYLKTRHQRAIRSVKIGTSYENAVHYFSLRRVLRRSPRVKISSIPLQHNVF